MKKKRRKGFTMVELLAVVIILSIVVGISIPAITNIISDSKNNALGVTVETGAGYLVEQYSIYNINTEMITISDRLMSSVITAYQNKGTPNGILNISSYAEELGFEKEDIRSLRIHVTEDGQLCLMVREIPISSNHYSVKYWSTETAADGTEYAIPRTSTNVKYVSCK